MFEPLDSRHVSAFRFTILIILDSPAFSIHIVEQISRPADFIPFIKSGDEQTDQSEVCFQLSFLRKIKSECSGPDVVVWSGCLGPKNGGDLISNTGDTQLGEIKGSGEDWFFGHCFMSFHVT